MATKETLEPREADCTTAEEFVALAKEALTDPADREYAREVLDKAELASQMPGDYIVAAEVAVALEDREYAEDLYGQAEDACFEPKELAELGHSLGAVLGDKEKAKEILERAADEAKDLADLLTISRYAREDVGDEELAKTLLGKVEESCKTLDDYRTLARTVLGGMNDRETAEAFYRKAEVICDDAPSMIAFAEGILEVFEDREWANETLEEVEGDAQFTKDFLALAEFHRRTGNAEKAGEMMEQAREYAMTGEENVLLGAAYAKQGDADAAVEAYRKALGEMDDKEQLLALAKTAARDLGNAELAKEVVERYRTKLTGIPDAAKLAKAAIAELEDRDLAADVYRRAEETWSTPNDALALAGEVLADLEDADWADRLYRRALDGTGDFGPLMKLLETARKGVESPELARAILEKAAGKAVSPPELLRTADQVMVILEDREMILPLLDAAEERVTSLDEMKKVVAAVESHLADDEERLTRVRDKLERREANQDLYAAFQKEEDRLTRQHEFVRLADRVMAEIGDEYYAAKLLREADTRMAEGAFSIPTLMKLAGAVKGHLGDDEWVGRLLDAAHGRARSFGDRLELCRQAARTLEDSGDRVRADLEAAEQSLGDEATAYDRTKLAAVVREALADDAWSGRLLDLAAGGARDPLALAHVAKAYAAAGNDGKAKELRRRAAGACSTVEQAGQLVGRLRADRLPDAEIRVLYEAAGEGFAGNVERLAWAERILDLWRDDAWAKSVYAELKGKMTSGEEKARFDASVQFRFDGKLD